MLSVKRLNYYKKIMLHHSGLGYPSEVQRCPLEEGSEAEKIIEPLNPSPLLRSFNPEQGN